MVDIHIIVSDFAWQEGDRESRVNALKGYLFAGVYALSHQAIEYVSKTQSHIVLRLTSEKLAPTLNDFESMLAEAMNCLPPGIRSTQAIMRIMLWPFKVIRKVLPFVGDRSRFPVELQRALKRASP
jgi:hypothetical protein